MSGSRIRQAFVLMLTLAAAGCGGGPEPRQAGGSPLGDDEPTAGGGSSDPVGPAHASGSERVATRVGPAGGTLELANGVRLEIPAGAVARPVEVVLQRAPS